MNASIQLPAEARQRVRRAANALLAARAGAGLMSALPIAAAPQSEAEAYAVQAEVLLRLGATIGGWKVAMNDIVNGSAAPIFSTDVLETPAGLVAGDTRIGIEPEIAFRLKSDLPKRASGEPYTRAEVLAAVDSAHAAIEIVISRYRSHDEAPSLHRLADNISNGGLVIGRAEHAWQRLNLTGLQLRLEINAEPLHEARGGHPLIDPIVPLVWLAQQWLVTGGGLKAGQVITTGSCAGLRYATSGALVSAQFAGLGTATLQL